MNLFSIAAQHRNWLAKGQSAIAENVANVNTPDFKARGVGAFAATLDAADALRLTATNGGHLVPDATAAPSLSADVKSEADRSTHSGNTVDLDQELMKAGEVRNGYALNAAVVKAFNRMLQASARS